MFAVVMVAAALLLSGCQKAAQVKPDYNKPLPPGANALRLLLSPADWPDLREPYATKDGELLTALDHSAKWYATPSSSKFFPLFDVTHLRARTSVYAFRKLLETSQTPQDFETAMLENFNCYTSVGFDDKGGVLYTGYFTPIFKGSTTPTAEFKYPLYRKPADLDIDPLTGQVKGRKAGGGGYTQFPSRKEIESSDMLKGTELVYVASRFDQYVIQVNGSAKIDLVDGKTMYVGYAGNNGHEYTGLGSTLVKEGKIEQERLNLANIREYFAQHPDEVERYIQMNDRYVFFSEYDGSVWPAGSLGVKVTPWRSLATDKSVFPRGSVLVVTCDVPDGGEGKRAYRQFMLDQDTGGAIRAAGRGDIYMGIGPEAEKFAGRQFSEGRLFYFFLKHEKVLEWHKQMLEDKGGKGPTTVSMVAGGRSGG
jgi:membrane-bound lytic murein transglycosylase A